MTGTGSTGLFPDPIVLRLSRTLTDIVGFQPIRLVLLLKFLMFQRPISESAEDAGRLIEADYNTARQMTLSLGTRLGPYEILSPLGTGGPSSARDRLAPRELWRGLAVAQQRPRL